MAAYKLKNIPADIMKMVQKEQYLIKEKKGILCYSFESTIYKMLRDYDRCRQQNDFKPSEE